MICAREGCGRDVEEPGLWLATRHLAAGPVDHCSPRCASHNDAGLQQQAVDLLTVNRDGPAVGYWPD